MDYILDHDKSLREGFGVVGKSVMTDRNISLGSKALYAYLASYEGCGAVIIAKVDTCNELNISSETLDIWLVELKQAGIINFIKD